MEATAIITTARACDADCASTYNALVIAAEETSVDREERALRAAAAVLKDEDVLTTVLAAKAMLAAQRAYAARPKTRQTK